MRRLAAALLIAAVTGGFVASVDAAKNPRCDAETGVCYVVVEQGDGWLAVAKVLAPDLTGQALEDFAVALEVANGGNGSLTQLLHPGRLVVYLPPDETTTTTTTATSTTTVAPGTSTTTVAPTSTTSTATTTTEPSSGECVGTPNTPGGADPWGGCFPGAHNTGPSGTLTAYTGPCDITTTGTVIESKVVNCPGGLYIYADNVTIRNSQVNDEIHLSENQPGDGLLIEDSAIDATGCGDFCRAIDPQGHSWTMRRSDVTGGYSSGWCSGCLLEDSWFHGIEGTHSSAMRFDQHSTAIHNVFSCDAPPIVDDPCSANTTGYPDFQPTMDWLIQRNLYVAHTDLFWYCAYGGNSGGKAYTNHPDNATNIRFIDNVFQRGGGSCGRGGPIADFDPNGAGNVWSGNRYDDGTPINPFGA